MKPKRVQIVAVACLLATAQIAAADNALTLHVNETRIQIEPRDSGRTQVNLPSLDLSLRTSFVCPAAGSAESVTMSIADTHERFGAENISDVAVLEATISVPAQQIAPVSLAGFCTKGDAPNESELLLPGIATAQVSLRCRSEELGSSMHYASAVVPLTVICLSIENQESSVDK